MGLLPNGEGYMIMSPVDEGAGEWETADANWDWATGVLLATGVANGDVLATGVVANGDVLATGVVANGDGPAARSDWGAAGGFGLAWGLEDTNGRAGPYIATGEERHSTNCLTGEGEKLVVCTRECAKIVVRKC